MADDDTRPPGLPDPHRDRHVAYPGDEAPSAARATPTLPPEAWAPRPVEARPPASTARTSTSTWRPDVPPGSSLTTPPSRPFEPRRRTTGSSLGGKLLAALVLVPTAIAFLSSGSQGPPGSTDTGDGGYSIQSPEGVGGLGDVPGVWAEEQMDPSGVAAPLDGSPKVQPVPADATTLRVEIVGDGGTAIDFQADANGMPISLTSGTLPYVTEIHLDDRPTSVTVTGSQYSSTGGLQCRVYAGGRLVAISSGADSVSCTPMM